MAWFEKQSLVKDSRMDKAVTYARNRIPYLMTYLEDDRCSLSNNPSENSIRPFVVGRKGRLFSDRPVGAEASAMCYTMVEMAKTNGVNAYHYLPLLLKRLPNSNMTEEELEQPAPWNESVKAEVAQMALAENL